MILKSIAPGLTEQNKNYLKSICCDIATFKPFYLSNVNDVMRPSPDKDFLNTHKKGYDLGCGPWLSEDIILEIICPCQCCEDKYR